MLLAMVSECCLVPHGFGSMDVAEASMTSFLLVFQSIVGGHPVIVAYFLHLLILYVFTAFTSNNMKMFL